MEQLPSKIKKKEIPKFAQVTEIKVQISHM